MSSIVQPLEITHHQQQPLQQQQNINVSNNQDLSNTSINPSNLSRILSSSSQKTSSFSQEQNKTDTATSVTVSSGGNNISTANNNNNKINNINSTSITITATTTPSLKGKQNNHLSSSNITNNIKNTNIDKKLTNNKKVTINSNNSNITTHNNTKTTNNTPITTTKRLNKKLSLQSFRSSINHNSNSNKNNNNNNTDNTSPVKNNNTNTKSSSLKEFSNKISINISSFFNKLKYITDQCLDSDEITDELFDSDSVFDSQENLIKNNINSNSVSNINTITVKSIDNKNQLNNHIMKFNTTTTANISTSTTLNTNTNTNTNTNSNSIIKSDGENLNNFSNGEELWKLQNEEWLTPSSENDTRQGKLLLQKKVHDQEIKHCISSKDYHIVYKNLVINNKKLKKPMNLKDLVKVIEAGWNWTKVFENSSSNRF